MFRYSALHAQKAGSPARDYEDSFTILFSADQSRVAVADGAGAAFESGRWARLLTSSFVQSPPGLSPVEVLEWSSAVARRWNGSFNWDELNPLEQDRVTQGSAATFVGLRLHENIPDQGGLWDCLALGDSCVFQVSGDRLRLAMPLAESAKFDTRPPLLYTSRPLTGRTIGRMVTVDDEQWAHGDQFLLLTDAMAEWFLRAYEDGGRPWETLGALDPDSFGPFIEGLRRQRLIRNDDVTVVILDTRVPDQPPPAIPVPEPPDKTSDEDQPTDEDDPYPDDKQHGDPGPPSGQAPPGYDQAERRRRSWEGYLGPLSRPAVVLPLLVAVVVGFLIGRALSGGSSGPGPALASSHTASPSPTASSSTAAASPTPSTASSSAAVSALDTVADEFVEAMVTSDGNLADYTRALQATATQGPAGLAGKLPDLFHLTQKRYAGMTSSGSIAFTVPGPGADTVIVGAQQRMVEGGKPPVNRFLLVQLTMTPAGSGWQVSGVALQQSVDRLLPL